MAVKKSIIASNVARLEELTHSRRTDRAGVVILGAGPAGISAAIALGPEAIILEQRCDIGGLTGSIEIQGAIFDYGGHSFHTPHPEVKELLFNSLEMFEQKREARCYSHGSIIPYPFQKHFRELQNPAIVAECEQGLREARAGRRAINFEAYLQRRFGSGIAEHFLLPYNRKLWGGDLKRLSAEWVGQRIAAPEGVRERFEQASGVRKPLQTDTTVAYPARGGFGEISKALLRKVQHLRLGAKVKLIDPVRRTLLKADGEIFHWKRLISTVPLNELLTIIEDVPAPLREGAGRLEYLSLKLVFIVVGRPVGTEVQRVYTAEASFPAHKIVINHNSSDYLRSLPRHGIMGEISYSSEKASAAPDIEKQFVKNLSKLGLIKDASEVLSASVKNVKYAYPVPTLGMNDVVKRLKEWLEARGIHSVGRFGEWAYINSDEALYRGLSLGRSIAGEL